MSSVSAWWLHARGQVSNEYRLLAMKRAQLGYAANTNCNCAVSSSLLKAAGLFVGFFFSPPRDLTQVVSLKKISSSLGLA